MIQCTTLGYQKRLLELVEWWNVTAIWIKEYCPSSNKSRQGTAFVMKVVERNPWTAIEAANSVFTRFAVRIRMCMPGERLLRVIAESHSS